MIRRHGWTLLFHDAIAQQLTRLHGAVERARAQEPTELEANANAKLFRALSRLIFETIPGDPAREEYRLGNTMGDGHRHWRRAKVGRRFRLFFRFDSASWIIIFAWVNDEHTLRSSGGKHVPYVVFQKMLERGSPPDDWAALLSASREDWMKR